MRQGGAFWYSRGGPEGIAAAGIGHSGKGALKAHKLAVEEVAGRRNILYAGEGSVAGEVQEEKDSDGGKKRDETENEFRVDSRGVVGSGEFMGAAFGAVAG